MYFIFQMIYLVVLLTLVVADKWEILNNWSYNFSSNQWHSDASALYSLIVLSDHQWYDASNSFTITYNTTIDFGSSKDEEVGLMLFNSVNGVLCESYFISVVRESANSFYIDLYRIVDDDWFWFKQEAYLPSNIVDGINDYNFKVIVTDAYKFQVYLDDILYLNVSDNNHYVTLINGYSGYIGFFSERNVATTIKSFTITGIKTSVPSINVPCECVNVPWMCSYFKSIRSENVTFHEPTYVPTGSTHILSSQATTSQDTYVPTDSILILSSQETTSEETYVPTGSIHILYSLTSQGTTKPAPTINAEERPTSNPSLEPYASTESTSEYIPHSTLQSSLPQTRDMLLIILFIVVGILVFALIILLCYIAIYFAYKRMIMKPCAYIGDKEETASKDATSNSNESPKESARNMRANVALSTSVGTNNKAYVKRVDSYDDEGVDNNVIELSLAEGQQGAVADMGQHDTITQGDDTITQGTDEYDEANNVIIGSDEFVIKGYEVEDEHITR